MIINRFAQKFPILGLNNDYEIIFFYKKTAGME